MISHEPEPPCVSRGTARPQALRAMKGGLASRSGACPAEKRGAPAPSRRPRDTQGGSGVGVVGMRHARPYVPAGNPGERGAALRWGRIEPRHAVERGYRDPFASELSPQCNAAPRR